MIIGGSHPPPTRNFQGTSTWPRAAKFRVRPNLILTKRFGQKRWGKGQPKIKIIITSGKFLPIQPNLAYLSFNCFIVPPLPDCSCNLLTLCVNYLFEEKSTRKLIISSSESMWTFIFDIMMNCHMIGGSELNLWLKISNVNSFYVNIPYSE